MRVLVAVVVALTTILLCSAADLECRKRKLKGLPMHWSNPTDCGRFYRCSNKNVKREVVCQQDKVYNPKTGKCSSRSKSSCKVSQLAVLADADNVCNGQLSGTYVAKPGECRNFYICNDNLAYEQSCDAGSLFDAEAAKCVPDGSASCWQNRCIGVADGTYLPDDNSCLGFYVCKSNEAVQQSCSSGSYYDKVNDNCIPDENNANCWENFCLDKSEGTLLANYDDCSAYYQCTADKTTVIGQCLSDSYFDRVSLGCEPGQCPYDETTTDMSTTDDATTDDATTDDATTDEATTDEVTTDEATTDGATTDEATTDESTTDEATTDDATTDEATTDEATTDEATTDEATTEGTTSVTDCNCPGGYKEGDMVAHPTSCELFYICYDSELIEQSCQFGNYFSTEENACVRDTNNVCPECHMKSRVHRSKRSVGRILSGNKKTDNSSYKHSKLISQNDAKMNPTTTIKQPNIVEISKPTNEMAAATSIFATKKCLGLYNEGDMIADPAECHKFRMCFGGRLIEQSCQKDEYFNAIYNVCLPDTQGVCTENASEKHNSTIDKQAAIQIVPITKDLDCGDGISNGTKLSHPTDSTKYYICIDGILELECCGEGLVFDISCSTCVSATCPGGYTEGQKIPHPSICSEYYTCSNGLLKLGCCDEGFLFDKDCMSCIPDTNGECWPPAEFTCPGGYFEGQKIPDPSNCSLYQTCFGGSMIVSSCGEGKRFDSDSTCCVPDDGTCWPPTESDCTCPGGYKSGEKIPHQTNCSLFYICDNRMLHERPCGVNFKFDNSTKECVSDDGTCWPPTESDCTCPGGYTSGEMIPHQTNCSLFYICDNGMLHERPCGVNFKFDNSTKECVPDDGTCWPPTESDCTCPGGYKSGQMVSHPSNCSLFYMCYNSKLIESNCGIGNRFDSDTMECVPDIEGKCNPINLCVGKANNAMVSNPMSCNSFYLCNDGEAVLHSCYEKEWFDPNFNSCVPDLNAECLNPCNQAGTIDFLPHPKCNQYYFCNNGQVSVRSCEHGNFDPKYKVCKPDSPCENQCEDQEDGLTFPVNNNDMMFYVCINGVMMLRSCELDTLFNSVLGICEIQPSSDCEQNICDGADDDKVAPTQSGDPKAFCRCKNGKAYKEYCPVDTIFDDNYSICISTADCDPTICPNSEDYEVFSNRNNMSSFCMCMSNTAIIVPCPKEEIFNPVNKTCQSAPVVDPNCDRWYCFNKPDNKTFSALTNSDKEFCYCKDNGAVLVHCPLGIMQLETNVTCISYDPCDSNKCTADVITFPVEDDPTKFCYCASGKAQLFDCEIGTEYNKFIGICLPNPCDKTHCANPDYDGHPFGVTDDKSKFCFCEGTNTYWDTCDDGTIFNDDYRICLPKVVSECDITLCADASPGHGYPTPAIDDPYSFCYCFSPVMVSKFKCPEDMKYNCEAGFCEPEPFCITEEQNYTQYDMITNPTACNKYYFCFNGDLLDLTCPNGMYFDSVCKHCLPNDNNQCGIVDTSNCTCPGGYREGQFLAHPKDCQKFYICSNRKLKEADCGTGNYFDADKSICVPDTKNICHPLEGECTCVGTYREGDMVANPSNSQLYYVCFKGRLLSQNCGVGNEFNTKSGSCQKQRTRSIRAKMRSAPSSSSVAAVVPAVTVEPEEYLDLQCVEEGEKRSMPSNCTQFELCHMGQWLRTTCPDHFYYNPERQACLEPRDDTVCAYARLAGLQPCSEELENVVVPSRNRHCGVYLRCSRGKWRLKNCPKQLLFSAELRTCIASDDTNICHPRNDSTSTISTSVPSLDTASSSSSQLLLPKCMHTQVRAYEPNCAMYYMCLEGDWWFQYCPLGMYFHQEHNYCVPNDAGQCAAAGPMPSPGVQLDQKQCSREGAVRASALGCDQFYVCAGGLWQAKVCPPDWYFNVTREQCVAVAEGDDVACLSLESVCDEGRRRPFPLNCTAYEECRAGRWARGECGEGLVFDDVIAECVPNDGSCSSNGLRRACQPGTTKAHPTSETCGEFYYCGPAGDWQLGACLKGYTYVDPPASGIVLAGSCVLGDPAGNCARRKDAEDPASLPVAADTEQPCKGKADGVAVAHMSDCSKFHLCVGEMATQEQSCASGSFFDAELGYCRPNDGACRVPLTGPCTGQDDGAVVPNPEDCASFYRCSTLTGSLLLHCPDGEFYHNYTRQCRQDHGECREQPRRSVCADQEHGARLPHEQYCNIYYACVRGLAVPIECPDEQRFNELLRRCQPDEERTCQHGQLVDDGNNSFSVRCDRLPDGSYVADQTDCTKYYICSGGLAQLKQCAAGSFFDSALQLCVPDDGSCPLVDHQPVPPDPIVCTDRHGDLMPDPANCNEFYVCINGKLRHDRCYDGHFFNRTSYQCHPYDSDGDDSSGSGHEVDSRSKSSLRGPVAKTATKTTTTMAQCKDQPTNFTSLCLNLEHGTTMAEQGDCRRYISCEEEEPVSQRCRNGESYDSLLGFCRQNDGTCLLENGQRVGVCNGKHGQLARDTDNCRGYFVCINGQKIPGECAENEYFSKTDNVCQKDELQQCTPAAAKANEGLSAASGLVIPLQRNPDEKICSNAVLGHRYANLDDRCQSYYVCQSNGTVLYEKCAPDELFNELTSECEPAAGVKCRRPI